MLKEIQRGEPCLLVGTQMLAKGHHLPHVTLVVVVNADGGLYAADFRALEHSAQLLEQVAGRAGRAAHPGRVLVQTGQEGVVPRIHRRGPVVPCPFVHHLLSLFGKLRTKEHGSSKLLSSPTTGRRDLFMSVTILSLWRCDK